MRKVANLLAQALTLYVEGHLLVGAVVSCPIMRQSHDRQFMAAGSDLGDRYVSLEPAIPILRTSEGTRHLLLNSRPVERGEEPAVYVDVNSARRAFVVGIYGPPF